MARLALRSHTVWRLLHLLCWAIVALQTILGQACFLTIWQDVLEGGQDAAEPLVMQWVNSAIYWTLPIWVFSVIYLLAFSYVLALLWIVPLGRRE